jgi:hypothetical protein
MSQAAGYILRIASEEWVDHVFNMAIYYTNLTRKWNSGQTVLFVHKTHLGDAFVGYGVFDRMSEKDELPDDEKLDCQHGGWKRAIEFKYVKRFENPLPIKKTFLKNSKLRGRFFQGMELKREQVESILKQADSR